MLAERSQPQALPATTEDTSSARAALVDRLFSQARSHDEEGRNREARSAYEEVLRVDPKHFDALTRLGVLLSATGHRVASKAAFLRAAETSPYVSIAHSNLATLLCGEEDFVGARRHYGIALRLDRANRNAHRGMAIVCHRLGDAEGAKTHGRIGFRGEADSWPYRGKSAPVSVLIVLSAGGNNTPIEPLVDDRLFLKWTLLPEFFDEHAPLPPHDIVFNCVGDADCQADLDAAAALLARTNAPILNAPRQVRTTGRAANADRLARIPGVVTAKTALWSRESFEGPGAALGLARSGFTWPLLVRSPGYHTGHHFVKVEGPDDLREGIAALPGRELLVIQFVDTRSADAKYRKYRVMMLGGRLYPLHLAVSPHWKVHYFSADMAAEQANRAEDARFLEDMPSVLGPAAVRALEQIRDVLDLDYAGVDFALDPRGNVVVFEANATMIVTPPGSEAMWAYRAAPVDRVWRAFSEMLLHRAGRPGGDSC